MANQIQDNRKPRGTDAREIETRSTEVRQQSWSPAHDLPTPNPVDGYVHRWIRVSMIGTPDPANMAKARREGWVPCKAADYPEISADLASFGLAPTTDLIEIGGLVLCRTTVENAQARQKYYENLTQGQAQAVDNSFLRENDPRMPLFKDTNTKVSFGSGF